MEKAFSKINKKMSFVSDMIDIFYSNIKILKIFLIGEGWIRNYNDPKKPSNNYFKIFLRIRKSLC